MCGDRPSTVVAGRGGRFESSDPPYFFGEDHMQVFDFDLPVSFFEKADAEPGKERRIGGIATLETKDRQGEIILARGVDFSDFVQNGWFNDNHSKNTTDILGYPEQAKFFRKGSALPNGETAKAAGHWVEGYLLNTPGADKVWELGRALAQTNRRLGFSVEGKIEKRTGPLQKTIAKALVRNIAITNCPVNAGARMEILAKSLQAAGLDEEMEKMLGMGTATPGAPVVGPQSGMGAGRVVTGESLEHDETNTAADEDEKKRKKRVKKSMTEGGAFVWLRARLPHATPEQLGRIITLTRAAKARGK